MAFFQRTSLAGQLHNVARPFRDSREVIEPLLEMIGDARIVMIGEASHGTHEFYDIRAAITRELIAEHGFTGVCAEADWPDAWRVNRFVRGEGEDASAAEALAGFKRFPQWMWRNTVVLEFVNWLRQRNESLDASAKAGFYGIDLYSMNQSIRAVLDYLDKRDPAAAKRARYRYSCFEDFGEDPQAYGYAASFNLDRTCADEVLAQLIDLQKTMTKDDGASFFAHQNARLVKNAERYYRAMFEGDVKSWNLRDEHMAETVEELITLHDKRLGRGRTKLVIWAHNSHLGDARATEMSQRGEWNVGQLIRERFGDAARNIGFTTHSGTVTAASNWDGPAETKRVRPGMRGSWEETFHDAGEDKFLLRMMDAGAMLPRLREPLLERAIGVIYRPQTERLSHYFAARLADQFDAVIHLDQTSALIPLDREPIPEVSPALEETYPTGI